MRYHRKTRALALVVVILILVLCACIESVVGRTRRACPLVIYPDGQKTREDFVITTQAAREDVIAYYDAILQPMNDYEDGSWNKREAVNGTCMYSCSSSNVIEDTALSACICISEVDGSTQIAGYRNRGSACSPCLR